MKPVVFNKNSWHFKLACRFTKVRYYKNDDEITFNICWYSRQLLLALLITALLAFWGCMLVLAPIGSMLGWFVAGILYGFVTGSDIVLLGMAETSLLFLVGGAFLVARYHGETVGNWIDDLIYKHEQRKLEKLDQEPSIVVALYRKFKDKACFMVQFK